ncbi:MAG: Flp pilus assembly complex ATPase component TadA [Candidatus Riflebacteria bacterium]|nr:Flp pilus assembly complex ATPase component TadA [Candidatus Riflebacteria bacterium]
MKKENKCSRTFLVTSFQGGIGKTFVATELAKAIHDKTGKSVALIELNLLRPSSLVESLDKEISNKMCLFDYYTSNWGIYKNNDLDRLFYFKDGIYYIPFSGIRKSETLRPCFNFNESDITDSLSNLLKMVEEQEGYTVIDATFQFSPLPVYLLSRADSILYVYSSQAPSPNFARTFNDEIGKLSPKVLWVKNFADLTSGEASLFDNEFQIPLSADLEGNLEDTINQNVTNCFKQLAVQALEMPAAGVIPGDFTTYDKQDNNHEILEYRTKLRQEVLDSMEKRYGISDVELRDSVERKIEEAIRRTPPPASGGKTAASDVKKYLIDEILGLGPLEDFMRDEDVDEIMVNGPDKIFVEKHGRLQLTVRKFTNADHVRTVIERILMPVGRTVNERTPYVDARLLDGSRVHAIIPPLSLTGPMITIRKFSRIPFTMDDLVRRFKSLTNEAAEFLRLCVRMKKNIIVSGGAGSGKTTMLNVLSNYIMPTERVICIEDSAELKLNQLNLGRLEARQQGTEAKTQVTIRDLLRNALRMRPDRIIVGECRGAETIDMLQAMNTGHDGSLTTLHANSSKDALARLETLVLMAGVDLPLRAIREQIASSVNIVIQSARMTDGKRRIMEIVEITGIEENVIQTKTVFKFDKKWLGDDGEVIGSLEPTGYIPSFLVSKGERSGHDYSFLFQKKSDSKKEEIKKETVIEKTTEIETEKAPEKVIEKIESVPSETEVKEEKAQEISEQTTESNEVSKYSGNKRNKFRNKKGGRR